MLSQPRSWPWPKVSAGEPTSRACPVFWPLSDHHGKLGSRRWARVRRMVFERDGWRCRKCGRAGRLEAHHLQSIANGGDPWSLSNIETRCRACHIEEHRRPVPNAWRELVQALR